MQIPLYQIDAFASELFKGNPATVCPLSEWLPDAVMQSIGAENNLSETAFIVGREGRYRIRWFTPAVEVDLCGHATLASAWVVFNKLEPGSDRVEFESASGVLTVTLNRDLITLDFPALPSTPIPVRQDVADAIGVRPVEMLDSGRTMAVLENASQVIDLRPDFRKLKEIHDVPGLIVTAPGDNVDFVSRFFAPNLGIDEDPVTGSAHCTLIPYWAKRLGKSRLHAHQVSKRGGELWCEDRGERVAISGRAALYLEGFINL